MIFIHGARVEVFQILLRGSKGRVAKINYKYKVLDRTIIAGFCQPVSRAIDVHLLPFVRPRLDIVATWSLLKSLISLFERQ